VHANCSVSIADDGRGTDTRADDQGRMVKKPVMATKDLRFFGFPQAAVLPDGYPRRGMSVVTALSEWLVHTNRRCNGAWTQRYGRGIPVTGLMPIPGDGTTGTTVRFLPDAALVVATVAKRDPRRCRVWPWYGRARCRSMPPWLCWQAGGVPPPGLPVVRGADDVLVGVSASCPGGGPQPEDLRAAAALRAVPG
jgi:hypothetical protein